MATENTFSTLDIYLASFLSLHDFEPVLEIRNNKVVFLFEAGSDLYRLLSLYNSNSQVPVADFVTTAKVLRGKMLTLKEQIPKTERYRKIYH